MVYWYTYLHTYFIWTAPYLGLFRRQYWQLITWIYPNMLYKELGRGTLVARPYVKESTELKLKYTVIMPEKIAICLNRGSMESLGFDDVSIVHACK